MTTKQGRPMRYRAGLNALDAETYYSAHEIARLIVERKLIDFGDDSPERVCRKAADALRKYSIRHLGEPEGRTGDYKDSPTWRGCTWQSDSDGKPRGQSNQKSRPNLIVKTSRSNHRLFFMVVVLFLLAVFHLCQTLFE